jgi:hypothetical protein
MENGFRIERYRSSDREQVFDLVRASIPPAAADRMIKQWNWKYDSNPFNAEAKRARVANRPAILPFIRSLVPAADLAHLERSDQEGSPYRDTEPYCLLIRNDRAIAGMGASIPQLYTIGGVEHWAAIGGDFAIRPEYRRHHLSVRLGHTIIADVAILVGWTKGLGDRSAIAIDRAVESKASDLKYAWAVGHKRVPILVKPTDWPFVAGQLSDNAMVKKAAGLLGSPLDGLREKLIMPRPARGVAIRRVSSFDDGIDKLWERARNYYPVMLVRSRRQLAWRFVARPDASYAKFVAVDGANLVGYMICLTLEANGMRCGYIVDFLTDNESPHLFALLLNAAEMEMVREGAKVICIMAPRRYWMWRYGYFPGRPASRSNLVARVNTANPALRILSDLQQWFITMAEGDFEYNL